MKKYKKIVIALSGLILIACISILYIPVLNRGFFHLLIDFSLSESVPTITINDINTEKDIIIDTRSINEYKISHLPNAIWMGETIQEDLIPKSSQRIILYCSIGKRSELTGEQLLNKGHENVYNLYGGIFEWHNQGHVIVDNSNDTTTSVHPFSTFWGLWLKN